MYNFLPIAYFQDKFVPFAEATISIATHALHYGTGAFGGMRGIPNPENPSQILLFRLDRHSQRLSQSAKFLHYNLPATKIQETIIEFVKKNRPTSSFYIRPFVYTSDLGIAPRLHNIDKNFAVYGIELGDYLSPAGVSCRISSWQRQEDASFPLRGKICGAYITSSLAKTEAAESGFDEAILMNSQGKVSEASGMNIFVVRNGQIITPGFDHDILEGITRDSVVTIAKNFGIPVIERAVDKSELLIADEVFLSGTAAKVVPVNRIENYYLPENRPISEKIREKLVAITENRDSEYQDWVFPIDI
ncbi:branched-chain amino acid transaminase [Calothrix sp. 336/3]|uniref:branched-chain amino acid transaminase n=1 Tax=Calothrix sp. 336/3 TaxID=1337936 RepID=UPI0004E2BD9B|nr:branched-chain amino acid transaminase [Calothrix sp. 336/3]AKG24292.1 branched-chain amino acid aminotransferase [Calothrix sp. 336/3]